ncbi:MAG: hypothetical protein PHF86_02980 [Candidatus Nanoarchaeia archaeon]|nr:hypothetical protein [Candidatus Nanoarchaeia archaeon]
MLKMTINDWKRRIDKQFESQLYTKVLINNVIETIEITNFEFCLIPEEIIELVPAPVEEEIIERDFIIKNSIFMYEYYLSKDINSRQAAFVNNYDDKDNHCISYFHHYIRDNKHCMNVYVRSMDYDRNFSFDCQTFNLAYKEVYNKLKKQYEDRIMEGYIRVFAFSLHKYI